MIYINLCKLSPPEGWEARRHAAEEELSNAAREARRDAIRHHQEVWRDIKDSLGALSYNKCWYCEAKEERSDRAVDHFRPKARVAERKDHSGYWWLAFRLENYRYTCTFCNSRRQNPDTKTVGGKGDHFPVGNEDNRAMRPTDNLALEDPVLLDPTVAADPGLLGFDESGEAYPRYSEDLRMPLHARARTSIDLYHLNHPDIWEARHSVCRSVRKVVTDGEVYFAKWAQGDYEAGHAFRSVASQLVDMVKPEAEFSAAAKSVLRGMRNLGWVDNVLQAA